MDTHVYYPRHYADGGSAVLITVLLTVAYPSTDKLILITLITQLLSNLFLNLDGKMPDFKK